MKINYLLFKHQNFLNKNVEMLITTNSILFLIINRILPI